MKTGLRIVWAIFYQNFKALTSLLHCKQSLPCLPADRPHFLNRKMGLGVIQSTPALRTPCYYGHSANTDSTNKLPLLRTCHYGLTDTLFGTNVTILLFSLLLPTGQAFWKTRRPDEAEDYRATKRYVYGKKNLTNAQSVE